jgi:hypothetical protein
MNVGINISELRDSNLNADGQYINSDGDIVPWSETPKFTFWLSIILSVASIYSNVSDMMDEKKILLELDTLEYCLNCMTGRLGMVPYLSKIKRMIDNKTKDDLLEINYLKIFKSNA